MPETNLYVLTMAGTAVATSVLHTLIPDHWLPFVLIGRARRSVINVSQSDQGNTISKKIKLRKGVAMKVECDVHNFMHAFVFVAKNPYYAVVNDKGEYTIEGVPAGKYTVKSWHGRLGDQEMEIEVSAGGKAEANFDY